MARDYKEFGNQQTNGVIEVSKVANLQPDKPHESQNIYATDGIAPTIMAGTHGWGQGYYTEIKPIGNKNDKN